MSHESGLEYSVVIVTFNNRSEIEACLRSVEGALAQSRFEIIVIDNASQDGTVDAVREIWADSSGRSGELYVLHNERNLGFTKALNQGLTRSKGEHLLILNPDTKVQPQSLQIMRKTLHENEAPGVVAPQLLNVDGSIQPSCRRFPRHRDVLFEVLGLSFLFRRSERFNHWKMGEFDHRARQRVDQPQGACLMFRRHLLQKVGAWDETFNMFFSDVDWCRRVKRAGYEIVFEPAAKVIHHQGRSVFQKRSRMIWSSHRSFYRYFRKYSKGIHYWLINQVMGALLVITAIIRIIATEVVGLTKRTRVQKIESVHDCQSMQGQNL